MLMRSHIGLLGLVMLLIARGAVAAPTISNVSLRGLTIGGNTTLLLQGNELAGEVKLIAPFAIVKQEVLSGSTMTQTQLVVTLADSVAPGIYAVRVATPTGISPPLMLGVDRLPQLPQGEATNHLPIAMTGNLSGGQIIKTSFAGKKDQPLVVEIEAQRFGANFKPVLRLTTSNGKQLAYATSRHSLGGDARIAIKLPADDTYTIELHDVLYRAGGPGFYRLKIGDLTYADFVLPLAVTRSTKSQIRFASTNLPNGSLTEIDATQQMFRADRAATSSAATLFSGSLPGVTISEAEEAVETAPAEGAKQTLAAVPCGISGQIAARGEEDQFIVSVTPGQKLRIEVTARRLGSLLDGVLIVRGAQGNELARSDDQPGTPDPGLDFAVPGDMKQIIVGVRDMENRFGPEHVYHVAIGVSNTPDIVASVAMDTIHVDSTTIVPVTIARKNFDGPVRLEVHGLVGDTRVEGTDIPPGVNSALLTITAKGGYPVHSTINIIARSTDANVPLARYVLGPATNGATRAQPWLRRDIGFAVIGPGKLLIDEDPAKGREKMVPGGKTPLPLVIKRINDAPGDVRLKLVTTQPMPKKKIKENNQDKEVDDVERALRLVEGTPIFKPDQKEVVVNLQIPADLPRLNWSAVIVAELLSPDGKTVVATTATSAFNVDVAAP